MKMKVEFERTFDTLKQLQKEEQLSLEDLLGAVKDLFDDIGDAKGEDGNKISADQLPIEDMTRLLPMLQSVNQHLLTVMRVKEDDIRKSDMRGRAFKQVDTMQERLKPIEQKLEEYGTFRDEADKRVKELEDKINITKAKLAALDEKKSTIDKLNKDYESLAARKEEIEKVSLPELQKKVETARTLAGNAEQQVADQEAELSKINAEIEASDKKIQTLNSQIQAAQNALTNLTNQTNEAEVNILDLSEILTAGELERLKDTYSKKFVEMELAKKEYNTAKRKYDILLKDYESNKELYKGIKTKELEEKCEEVSSRLQVFSEIQKQLSKMDCSFAYDKTAAEKQVADVNDALSKKLEYITSDLYDYQEEINELVKLLSEIEE